jgi:hypothetical protein
MMARILWQSTGLFFEMRSAIEDGGVFLGHALDSDPCWTFLFVHTDPRIFHISRSFVGVFSQSKGCSLV